MKLFMGLFIVTIFNLALAKDNMLVLAKKAKKGDESAMLKIFEAQKGKDGAFATDYQDIVADVFKSAPVTYIHVADKYFKGDLSCAVHLVLNESTYIHNISLLAKKSKIAHPTDIKLKKFYDLLLQQEKAIKNGENSLYLDCK